MEEYYLTSGLGSHCAASYQHDNGGHDRKYIPVLYGGSTTGCMSDKEYQLRKSQLKTRKRIRCHDLLPSRAEQGRNSRGGKAGHRAGASHSGKSPSPMEPPNRRSWGATCSMPASWAPWAGKLDGTNGASTTTTTTTERQ